MGFATSSRFATLIILLVLSTTVAAQMPVALVLLRGRVLEHVDTAYHHVGHCMLQINNYGNCQTRADGSFELKVPHENRNLKLEIQQPGYTIVQPREGTILIEGLPPRDTTIELKILILKDEDQADWKKLEALEEKLGQLEKENKLTQRQLNLMNQALVDTILRYQELKFSDQQKIARLDQDLEQSEADKRAAADLHRQNISKMDLQLESLMDELVDALEERYLLQKEYYDQITRDLSAYSSSIKDVRDQLKMLDHVFQSAEGSNDFRTLIIDYNGVYENINAEKEAQLEAVQHYWENDRLTKEASELYAFVLKDIHHNTVYDPLNSSIIPLIQSASVGGRPKTKKAQKTAELTTAELDRLITLLDEKIKAFTSDLSIF